jgi:hypothetical protein
VVLIGLIIIAVVLMALMVPGMPGTPVEAAGANASRRPGPGSARIPRHDIVSTLTSRDVEATGNPDQAPAHRQSPAITWQRCPANPPGPRPRQERQ